MVVTIPQEFLPQAVYGVQRLPRWLRLASGAFKFPLIGWLMTPILRKLKATLQRDNMVLSLALANLHQMPAAKALEVTAYLAKAYKSGKWLYDATSKFSLSQGKDPLWDDYIAILQTNTALMQQGANYHEALQALQQGVFAVMALRPELQTLASAYASKRLETEIEPYPTDALWLEAPEMLQTYE